MDWTTFIQQEGSKLLSAGVQSRVTQPYELNRLRLQALGKNGYYEEGKAGTVKAATASTIAGIPTGTALLIGGAVLLIVLMRD